MRHSCSFSHGYRNPSSKLLKYQNTHEIGDTRLAPGFIISKLSGLCPAQSLSRCIDFYDCTLDKPLCGDAQDIAANMDKVGTMNTVPARGNVH